MTFNPDKDPSLEEEIVNNEGLIVNKKEVKEKTDFPSIEKPEASDEDKRAAAKLSWELSTTKQISDALKNKGTGAEPYTAPVVNMQPSSNRSGLLKRVGAGVVFTFASLFGFGKSKVEAGTPSDSTKNKIDKVVKVEDSTKTNKENTVELKSNKIEWVEVNESLGNLNIEAKAYIPFSDTTKEVMIIKFTSGSDEEMIVAARNGGYKILSAEDFRKMYLENKPQVKNLRQTFSGEKVDDIDDTKVEKYIKADDEGVKTGIKKTHGVYPYINASGSLTRYEDDQQLNYESGLAVYKDKKEIK